MSLLLSCVYRLTNLKTRPPKLPQLLLYGVATGTVPKVTGGQPCHEGGLQQFYYSAQKECRGDERFHAIRLSWGWSSSRPTTQYRVGVRPDLVAARFLLSVPGLTPPHDTSAPPYSVQISGRFLCFRIVFIARKIANKVDFCTSKSNLSHNSCFLFN